MENTIERTTECAICQDCLTLFATGETDPNWTDAKATEFLTNVERHTAGCEITLGSIECEHCGEATWEADRDGTEECDGTKECEPWFSWQPCDTCGSPLGGSRYHAISWVRS